MSEINEEGRVYDRRNYKSECLVFHAADMNNGMVFHDSSRGAVNEEVLLDNGRNGGDDFSASQDANRNNELMHSETSKREENKEALVNMEFHDTSSSAVHEVLMVDRRSGDDDCAVSKDTDKNSKLVPYYTSRRKLNEEAMDDKVIQWYSKKCSQ